MSTKKRLEVEMTITNPAWLKWLSEQILVTTKFVSGNIYRIICQDMQDLEKTLEESTNFVEKSMIKRLLSCAKAHGVCEAPCDLDTFWIELARFDTRFISCEDYEC